MKPAPEYVRVFMVLRGTEKPNPENDPANSVNHGWGTGPRGNSCKELLSTVEYLERNFCILNPQLSQLYWWIVKLFLHKIYCRVELQHPPFEVVKIYSSAVAPTTLKSCLQYTLDVVWIKSPDSLNLSFFTSSCKQINQVTPEEL